MKQNKIKLNKVHKKLTKQSSYFLIIIILIGLIFIAIYYKERRAVYELTQYKDTTFSKDVVIVVEPNVIETSNGEITITTKNNTNSEIYHSNKVVLEVEIKGKWYQVPYLDEPIWKEESIVIPAFKSYSENFNLNDYFSMSRGAYRLIKIYYQNQNEIISTGNFSVK